MDEHHHFNAMGYGSAQQPSVLQRVRDDARTDWGANMTDHHHNPHDEPAKDKGWADNPKTVQMIWYGLIAICAVLFVADFFYEKHPYFPIETLPNFYGVYGFVGCVFLVLAAAQLRKLLMRPENYYEKKDAAYETKNLGQSSADKDAPDAPYEGHPHYEAEKAGKGH